MTKKFIRREVECANNIGRKRFLMDVILAIIWLSCARVSIAAPLTYTNEASFLAAASGISLNLESFESLPTSAPSPFHIGNVTLKDSQGTITANTIFPLTITHGSRAWGIGGVFRPAGTNDYPATIIFDRPVNAVGFDLGNALVSATLLTISVNNGPPILSLTAPPFRPINQVSFIGIVDSTGPITSLTISQNNQASGISIDRLLFGSNFTALNTLGLARVSGFSSDPVNTSTGNYVFSRTDLVIPGRGIPFAFQRTYNSQSSFYGPLGFGWTHSFNVILTENSDGSVAVRWGDGHMDFYDVLSDGSYAPKLGGIFDKLEKTTSGSFHLTRKDQTQYRFGATGRLNRIVDRNGNAIVLTYTSGRLTTITDTVGRAVLLSYDDSGRITDITDPIGRTIFYEYDDNGDLVSVTDPAGGVTVYSYDASHQLTEIFDENGNRLVFNEFDGSNRVVRQTNARGFTTTFVYDSPNLGDTTIADPRGNSTIHTHDGSFRLVKVTDSNAGATIFTYDTNNNRTAMTNQNGNTTLFTYDTVGNVTSSTNPLVDCAPPAGEFSPRIEGSAISGFGLLNRHFVFFWG